jgi:MoxR-like ATPase
LGSHNQLREKIMSDIDYVSLMTMAMTTPLRDGRWGLTLGLVGPPGIAKTSTINRVTSILGIHQEVIIGALREPAEFNGIPVPDFDQEVMRYFPALWAADAPHNSLFFFDEFSSMPPRVQAATLRVLFEGVVGEHPLPEGGRFIVAMNEVEDAANGHDIPPAMANRIGWIKWPKPSLEQWCEWMLDLNEVKDEMRPIDGIEDAVREAWGAAYVWANSRVQGFLHARRDLYYAKPKFDDPQSSRAWPSLRTWEYATRAMARAKIEGVPVATRDAFVAAFVGDAATIELTAWEKNADLPTPEDVLDEKADFVHDAARLDRTYAVLIGCAGHLTKEGPDLDKELLVRRSEVMWGLLRTVGKDTGDIVMSPARMLARASLLHVSRKAEDYALEVFEVVEEAKAAMRSM